MMGALPRLMMATALAHALASSVVASEAIPHDLRLGAVVCGSADDYRVAATNRAERARLSEAGTCIYIDDDAAEDIMQPFVTVLETDGELARVTFILEHYRRIAMLHRKFTRMRYTGWTATRDLTPREP